MGSEQVLKTILCEVIPTYISTTLFDITAFFIHCILDIVAFLLYKLFHLALYIKRSIKMPTRQQLVSAGSSAIMFMMMTTLLLGLSFLNYRSTSAGLTSVRATPNVQTPGELKMSVSDFAMPIVILGGTCISLIFSTITRLVRRIPRRFLLTATAVAIELIVWLFIGTGIYLCYINIPRAIHLSLPAEALEIVKGVRDILVAGFFDLAHLFFFYVFPLCIAAVLESHGQLIEPSTCWRYNGFGCPPSTTGTHDLTPEEVRFRLANLRRHIDCKNTYKAREMNLRQHLIHSRETVRGLREDEKKLCDFATRFLSTASIEKARVEEELKGVKESFEALKTACSLQTQLVEGLETEVEIWKARALEAEARVNAGEVLEGRNDGLEEFVAEDLQPNDTDDAQVEDWQHVDEEEDPQKEAFPLLTASEATMEEIRNRWRGPHSPYVPLEQVAARREVLGLGRRMWGGNHERQVDTFEAAQDWQWFRPADHGEHAEQGGFAADADAAGAAGPVDRFAALRDWPWPIEMPEDIEGVSQDGGEDWVMP